MEFVIIALALYLLPSIVALTRHHNNKLAIIALNILVGWTFIGWVISIVWALTSNVEYRQPKSLRTILFRPPWQDPPRFESRTTVPLRTIEAESLNAVRRELQ
jgi:hypothetical protein